jgi:putative two-component system response regulator
MNRNIQLAAAQLNENQETVVLERLLSVSNDHGPDPAIVSKLAEPRTKYLGKHVERIQILSHLLALEMRYDTACECLINDKYIKDIYYASALHDIGKNCIPEHILFKEGKLTPREDEVFKTHTEIGKRILVKLFNRYSHNDFSRLCIEIAGSHHEKWDGSGYPRGLYGPDIPLSARITALVDAYDTHRSEMPYKKAVSHKDSVEIILEGGGIDFDPSIVKAFSKIESSFADLYETIQ